MLPTLDYEDIIGDFDLHGRDFLLEAGEPLHDVDVTVINAVYAAVQRVIELQPQKAAELEELHTQLLQRQATMADDMVIADE